MKAPLKTSPDQYQSKTWFVEGIIFLVLCSAILAASSGLSKTPVPCFVFTNLVFVIPHSAQVDLSIHLLFLVLP